MYDKRVITDENDSLASECGRRLYCEKFNWIIGFFLSWNIRKNKLFVIGMRRWKKRNDRRKMYWGIWKWRLQTQTKLNDLFKCNSCSALILFLKYFFVLTKLLLLCVLLMATTEQINNYKFNRFHNNSQIKYVHNIQSKLKLICRWS